MRVKVFIVKVFTVTEAAVRRCSENMQQIDRRTPMAKSDLQLY